MAKKRSIYKNPTVSHYEKLDTRHVLDRRSERPLLRKDYPSDKSFSGGLKTISSVKRAVNQATYGAEDIQATATMNQPLERGKTPAWARVPDRRTSAAKKAMKKKFGL